MLEQYGTTQLYCTFKKKALRYVKLTLATVAASMSKCPSAPLVTFAPPMLRSTKEKLLIPPGPAAGPWPLSTLSDLPEPVKLTLLVAT